MTDPLLPAQSKLIYEVVCTYEVEADSKAAARRAVGRVAHSLARPGMTRSSGSDGTATLLKTTARFKRVAAHPAGGKRAEEVDELDRLRDLLARILASSQDGTIEIPDVAHAIEAEITEALNA